MQHTPSQKLSRRGLFRGALSAGSLFAFGAGGLDAEPTKAESPDDDRERWLFWLETVSAPLLEAAGRQSLRASMPVEAAAGHEKDRALCSPLEALGRLLAGLAPWLELEPSAGESARETELRARYRSYAQQAIASAVDPRSPDYMRFGESGQMLVDSAFLSLAICRAPRHLLGTLSSTTRQQLAAALQTERKVQPPFTNWLLFAAMNEVLLRAVGAEWDRLRIDYALREHQAWYLGDGTYGDGPQFHADYYNSYVIHPFLLAVLRGVGDDPAWRAMRQPVTERARRYAAIQERTISPRGEFPLIGRSITYRGGAFHLLADAALHDVLPEGVEPAAVRSALAAVQERTLTPEGTFSREGWLQIGVAGHQPGLGETYISTGSLYLASALWLPLGLPPSHAFWSAPSAVWTQKRLWSGEQGKLGHALDENVSPRRG